MRVLVGDRTGRLLAELRPQVVSASWVLNGIGKLELVLPARETTEEVVRTGNRVLVRFDDGLPDWGGVLDAPTRWQGGVITVHGYTVEQLLKWRLTDRGRYFQEATVGYIFSALLEESEREAGMGIEIGSVYSGGGLHSPEYHYRSLWWIISESLLDLEPVDVRFEPVLREGRIGWVAHLLERLGSDKSGSVLLEEGANLIEGTSITEQGPIINQAIAVGAGTTWGAERPVAVATDEASVAQYGLRQAANVYPSVSVAATLERHAMATVEEGAWPRLRFSVLATNREPGTWAGYDVGDTVRMRAPSLRWGYDGRVRVMAREVRPDDGVCELVVEEERETRPITTRVESVVDVPIYAT